MDISYLFFSKQINYKKTKPTIDLPDTKVKKKKKQDKTEIPKKKKKQLTSDMIWEHWQMFTQLLKFVFKRIKIFLSLPKMKQIEWEWKIGGEDPAKIGILYGLYQSVRTLLPDGKVTMNFLDTESSFYCNVLVSINLWKVFLWILGTLITFPYKIGWEFYKISR